MPSMPSTHSQSLPLGQRQRLLLRLLRLRSGRQVRRALARIHPADVAPLFPLLKPEEQHGLLEVLIDLRLAARTLPEIDDEVLQKVLAEFPDSRLAIIIGRMAADDAVDLLDHLEPDRRETVLAALEPALAARLNNLMLYGDATAGGIMDPDVIFFRDTQSVEETLEVIRKLAETRRLFYLYVTDDRGHLIGLVKLWQLLTASGGQLLREIMSRDVITVRTDTPQEEVARVFARYDLPLMPVLNQDGRLVGVITVDDVIDVIEEEASEDLYRLGGLPEPEGMGTPIARSLRLRLPWLGVSLVGAGLAGWLIGIYEDVIARYALLVAFMHVVGATGGQAGRQTLTVVVAGLATGDMELRRTWRVVGKQSLIGLINGLISGGLLALVALVLERNGWLAGVILVAQITNQLVAALVACATPLALRRFGLDPALGSSTAVVAAADLIGFVVFLALAARFSQLLP